MTALLQIVCIDCYNLSMINDNLNQDDESQSEINLIPNIKKNNKIAKTIAMSFIVGAVIFLAIFYSRFNFKIGDIKTAINPEVGVGQISPAVINQEDILVDWKNYALGDYAFKLPKSFVQNISQTSVIATTFNSELIDNLNLKLVLDGAGYGIQCADQIESKEVSALDKMIPVAVYQGLEEQDVCGYDSSERFWFLANLSTDDILAMYFETTDLEYDQAEKLFDQILSNFKQELSEETIRGNEYWKTFSNVYLKISYPPDLKLTERDASEIVLQKWGPTQKANTEFYDGISISIQPFELYFTAEDYAKNKIGEIERNGIGQITKPLAPITIGDYSGFTFSATGLGEHQMIILKSPSGMIINITNSTNDPGNLGFSQTVESILATLELK